MPNQSERPSDVGDAFYGGPGGQIGVQRYRSNKKYNEDSVIAFKASPESNQPVAFRAYPAVDLESGEIQPFYSGQGVTWARRMISVDWAGLQLPSSGSSGEKNLMRRLTHFWLVPSDYYDIWGDELKGKTANNQEEHAIFHSPYSEFARAMNFSKDISWAPREWNLLLDRDSWVEVAELKGYGVYDAPLPTPPQAHYVLQGQLLRHPKVDIEFSEKTYEDGRSPNSLHPVVLELSKSASKRLEAAIYNEHKNLELDGTEVDVDQGRALIINEKRVQDDFQKDGSDSEGGYKVHKPSFSNEVRSLDKEEVIKEWRPWTQKQAGREPVLNRMSSQEQIKTLGRIFGPESIEFAFLRSESAASDMYRKEVPEEIDGIPVRGSLEKLKNRLKEGSISWLHLQYARLTGLKLGPSSDGQFRPDGSEIDSDQEAQKDQRSSEVPYSKEELQETIGGDEVSSEDKDSVEQATSGTPGGIDPQEKAEFFDQIDAKQPPAEQVQNEQEEEEEIPEDISAPSESSEYDINEDEIPF